MSTCSLLAAGTGTLDHVSGWYEAGSNITVTATPALYSQFDHWSGDTNGASIAGVQITFDVTAAKSLAAVFRTAVTQTNSVPYEWIANQDPSWTNDYEAAVTNDPDGDGFTTAQEYWSGTDPTNAASCLQIDDIQISSTNFRLIWAHSHVDGNIPAIAIQNRASMSSGAWSTIGTNMPANGTNFWDAPGQQAGFYRLAVTNMP